MAMRTLATAQRTRGQSGVTGLRTLCNLSQNKSDFDWSTPLLASKFPNAAKFAEWESDAEDYNDIYVTY